MTVAALDVLGRRVAEKVGIPKDSWEIAAQLEVMGMRDSDARSGYGARDLFDLARALERRFAAGAYGPPVIEDDPPEHVNALWRFVRRYFAGIAFAIPMAMQAASMLLWGYGIWGAIDLELVQGSALALGFVTSYVVAGGFAQAIVRRGLFYYYQKEEGLARWAALRGFAIALRAGLILLVPALLLNALFRMLPWSMVIPATIFYVGLTILWLSWAILYLVRRTELLIVITAIALLTVVGCARYLDVEPIVANGVGVAVADLLSVGAAVLLLRRMARGRGTLEPVNPPRLAVLVLSTSRYFVYGLLFNAFLFADRVLAWTTSSGRDDFPPYAFWLSVRYELAMDLALVVIIVMGGVVQYAIERFSELLVPEEKATPAGAARDFVASQLRAHRRRSMQLAAAAAVALIATYLVVAGVQQVDNARLQEALTADVTLRVLIIAALSYVLFMFGVRNLLVLLTLSRVDAAVRSLGVALLVNVLVGFVCSRAIGYWAAVLGLAAGSVVLAFMAARETRHALDRLDYSFYAAY